jgi:hypothetical protein
MGATNSLFNAPWISVDTPQEALDKRPCSSHKGLEQLSVLFCVALKSNVTDYCKRVLGNLWKVKIYLQKNKITLAFNL